MIATRSETKGERRWLSLAPEERTMRGRLCLLPLAAFLFSHAALVTLLTEEALFAENFSFLFHFFEHVGGGVIENGFAGERCGDSFL